jgi:hypothetical protein
MMILAFCLLNIYMELIINIYHVKDPPPMPNQNIL